MEASLAALVVIFLPVFDIGENTYFIDVNVNLINITNHPNHNNVERLSSAIASLNFPINNNFFRFSASIGHFIVKEALIAGLVADLGFVTPALSQRQVIIISNIQVDLSAIEINAVGVTRVNGNTQQNPTILLLSGNGTLREPNHLLFPNGSCAYSLIDWSGVGFNTQNVGCSGAALVESITPSGWRTAHNRLAQELCTDNPHACHYVNEVPLALIKGDNNTFFLVSQQTHPYNNTITDQKPIRVTQWNWNDLSTMPRINTDFAVNGTQLSSANVQVFPASSPLSVSVDREHLFMLFDESGIKLVSLPLTMNQDTSYQIQTIISAGHPVQLEGKNIWFQTKDKLTRFAVFFNPESPSLSIPLEMNHSVVGVAETQNYIYVAYTMNIDGTNAAHALRFLANGTLDHTWQATLSEHDQYRYRQLNVRGDENDPQVNLPLVSEVIHNASPDGKALTVLLSPRGGYGDWRYGEEAHMSTSIITQSITEPTDVSTCNGTLGAEENNNNSNAAAVAVSVIITVAILVPTTIAGTLGAKILYNKLRLKKVELSE